MLSDVFFLHMMVGDLVFVGCEQHQFNMSVLVMQGEPVVV